MKQVQNRKNRVCEKQGKGNCALVLQDSIRQARLASRQEFIDDNRDQWIVTGMEFHDWRQDMGLTVAYVAREMGISEKRLKRFENGEPVQLAKQLARQYELLLCVEADEERTERLWEENDELKRMLEHTVVVVEVNGQRWAIPTPTNEPTGSII